MYCSQDLNGWFHNFSYHGTLIDSQKHVPSSSLKKIWNRRSPIPRQISEIQEFSNPSVEFPIQSRMTEFFPPFAMSAPSQPSPLSHFFRSSASGRDSPRTLVAEEMFKLHIDTPPIQVETSKSFPFPLEIPHERTRRHSRGFENLTVGSIISSRDPLFRVSPTKRRSPRKSIPILSPLEEMDTKEDLPSPTPLANRPHSPPPPDISSDSDDELCEKRPPDERTRYLRQKKREEQIAAYRKRELKNDRESRIARRNNPLSPKGAKVAKQPARRVKFSI